MRSKLVGSRRIILVFTYIFHAYSYDTYILVVRCMKQSKDTVWCFVPLLVSRVRADPKYSYSHIISHVRCVCEDFYFCFFTEIFHFFNRYLVVVAVVGTIFFNVSITCGATHAGRILFDTKQKH